MSISTDLFFLKIASTFQMKKSGGNSRLTEHTSGRPALAGRLSAIEKFVVAFVHYLLGMTGLASFQSLPAGSHSYPAASPHKIPAEHSRVLLAGITVKRKVGTTVNDDGNPAK